MDFDINFLRSVFTLLLFIGFVSMSVLIFIRPKGAYDEAANVLFEEPKDHE
ncbi:MAG: CcoQ/FixQ family Cbb3-type cytochrome c oxidase assembly chaperone [Pseudomonadales bacterium]|nr:CcoQ/FixQ family Cbb3-type cytochrome c oxidase assembly chaperone [Pseudomonadales bacterium]